MPTAKKAAAAKKPAPAKKAAAPAKKAPAKKPAPKAKAKPAAKAPAPRKPKFETLMDSDAMAKAIAKLGAQIAKDFVNPRGMCILGVRTRGVVLAERLKAVIEKHFKEPVASGVLDITFYRDDLSRLGPNPMVRGSEIPFDLYDARILLVDDVLFTGRTIRAALDEICDFGRPGMVRLAVLVDRGLRELPIQADYVALDIQSTDKQSVLVKFEESDDKDEVLLETR